VGGPTSNVQNVIYTLPVGYRPAYRLTMDALGCANPSAAVSVGPNGDVTASSSEYVCNMDELTFRAG
jgi:hypothetical protein